MWRECATRADDIIKKEQKVKITHTALKDVYLKILKKVKKKKKTKLHQ